MVWNWIFSKLFSPKRIEYLIKSNQKVLAEAMKDSIQDVLEDEEIAAMVLTTTDHIYARYLGKGGKLWSTIGGVQKGINKQVEGEMEKMNPLMGLFSGEEELSMSGIAKSIIRNIFNANNPQSQPQTQNQPRTRVVPNM